MSEQQNTPPPAAKPEKGEPTRYAVYDTVLLKFVGPVCATKPLAQKEARQRGLESGAYEIREV